MNEQDTDTYLLARTLTCTQHERRRMRPLRGTLQVCDQPNSTIWWWQTERQEAWLVQDSLNSGVHSCIGSMQLVTPRHRSAKSCFASPMAGCRSEAWFYSIICLAISAHPKSMIAIAGAVGHFAAPRELFLLPLPSGSCQASGCLIISSGGCRHHCYPTASWWPASAMLEHARSIASSMLPA